MYQYSYLIGDLIALIIWIILFLWRKDVRREMIIMSFLFGIAGPISELIYTIDWWRPLTMTGTIIGIEDFIFGFVIGGIASVIYEELFKKKLMTNTLNKTSKYNETKNLFFIGLILAILFLFCFFVLRINSFYSSIIALIIPTIYIWIKRRDLIFNSFATGIIMIIVFSLFYIVPELISPGWIATTWYFNKLSDITILKIPIEDIIWLFFAGLFIGPVYEFCISAKLVKKK